MVAGITSSWVLAALLLGAPTSEEALEVVRYYYDGAAEGPILLKSMPCLKVDDVKDSKTKNECIEPVGEAPIAKGKTVHLWTMWLVPVGGTYDDVMVQVSHDGVVRETKDIKLTESLRMRTWRYTNLSKPGKWTFKVLRGQKELATHEVNVE